MEGLTMAAKIRYSAIGDRAYVWHVVTSEGVVIAGEVVKHPNVGTWRAVITHRDGDIVRTPTGGVFTGYSRTRAVAVERALFPLLNPAQHHLNLMNT
jgi:hypothetical protein